MLLPYFSCFFLVQSSSFAPLRPVGLSCLLVLAVEVAHSSYLPEIESHVELPDESGDS